MKVSVVVCTYSMDRFDVFCEAVDSVLEQTYDPLEVVLVIDGNEQVYDKAKERYGHLDETVIHNNEENRGISYSRTKGAKLASGEIVAMIDDDARAEPDWIEEHVEVYESVNAYAVSGPVEPEWVTGKPDFFPEEFYWLVGCTERDFAEHMEEIRNGYGSNISFRRAAFLDVGGYDTHTGRRGDKHIQAHEAPICIRIRRAYDTGVVFTENAVVHHKLFDYRGDFGWLVKRSFWQGFSKRVMALLYPDAQGEEAEFLRNILFKWGPDRATQLVTNPSTARLKQLLTMFLFTSAVGLGYLYGMAKPNLLEEVETNPDGE